MEIYTNVSFRDKCFFVKLIEHFEWRENYCLVFEKLSLNLYECLKLFNNKGIYRNISKKFRFFQPY